jgi:hypothetical protein
MGTTTISAPPGVPFIDMTREFDARPRFAPVRADRRPVARPRRLTMLVDR